MPLNKPIHFIAPSKLKPNEEVIAERAFWLHDKIQAEQLWRVPITVDKDSMSIMDGHHRYTVAMRLGLSRVPCIMLSYDEVEFMSTHPQISLTPTMVTACAIAGKRLPAKSTRHQFKRPLPTCNVSLKLLFDNSYHLV